MTDGRRVVDITLSIPKFKRLLELVSRGDAEHASATGVLLAGQTFTVPVVLGEDGRRCLPLEADFRVKYTLDQFLHLVGFRKMSLRPEAALGGVGERLPHEERELGVLDLLLPGVAAKRPVRRLVQIDDLLNV